MRFSYPAVRELNFPKIPMGIIDNLSKDYQNYSTQWAVPEIYKLTNTDSKELDDWCKKNICETVDWKFQIITGNTDIHRDHRPYGKGVEPEFPEIKFVYQLSIGGDNVLTEIYNQEDNEFILVETYKFELHKWYLFNVRRWHRVIGLEPNSVRFAVVGHVF